MTERRKSHQRARQPPNLRLTPRDTALLRKVWEYRFLTTRLIQRLVFFKEDGGNTALTNVRTRLRLLYDHGFLERVVTPAFPGEGRPECISSLGPAGAAYLETQGVPSPSVEFPSGPRRVPAFLEHELLVAQVMVRFEEALRGEDALELKTLEDGRVWYHERTVVNPDARVPSERYLTRANLVDPRGKRKLAVKPDAVFLLRAPHEDHERLFFVEMDRDTVGTKGILDKQLGYHLFHEKGLYRRYGERLTGFRVLFLSTRSDGSLRRLAHEMEQAGRGADLFTLARIDDLEEEGFLRKPLWLLPGKPEKASLVRS